REPRRTARAPDHRLRRQHAEFHAAPGRGERRERLLPRRPRRGERHRRAVRLRRGGAAGGLARGGGSDVGGPVLSRIDFVTGAPEKYAHLVDALATVPDRLRLVLRGRTTAELRREPGEG